MPLSEHEQRLLEQIERSLLDEDPKFASAVRASDPRQHALRRVVWAAVLFVVGVGLLVLGPVTGFAPGGVPVLALAGFAVMFYAAFLGVQAYRRGGRAEARAAGRSSSAPRSRPAGRKSSFVDRLEERWKRRRDGGSF